MSEEDEDEVEEEARKVDEEDQLSTSQLEQKTQQEDARESEADEGWNLNKNCT